MLSAPVFWKVKSLVATHSAQSNEQEIENILKMNNDNDRIALLISLLDEVDFRDNYNRDEHKLKYLKDELAYCFRRPNCVAQICMAFENGVRQEMFKQGSKILETLPSNVCTMLNFSAAECVTLAYCLTQSQYRIFAGDSFRILKIKCPEINSFESVANIHPDVLSAIAQYVYNSEELSQPAISEKLIAIVKARNAGAGGSFGGLSLNPESLSGPPKVSIAQILGEIGGACTASADTFRNTLHKIGVKIDEEQLAAIIVTTLARAVSENEEKKKLELMPAMYSPWNLEVVADVLFQECRGLNWALVAKCLDLPALVIRSESDYQLLTRFFVRISGTTIPVTGLLSNAWNNRTAHLAMLTLAASSPRNIVDFSAFITAEQLISGEGINTPPNLSWLCLPLFSRFLVLASSGLAAEVMDVLTKAANTYPEYFIVSLSQIQDTTNSGVRAELLRRLLPLFTGLQGSRPTYPAVMRKLHAVNPDILVLLCRIAFKKAKLLWEVSNVSTILSGLGTSIIRKLEEEGLTEELMSYYCVKADKGELNLEEKVAQLVDRDNKNARVFVNFAKMHMESMRARSSPQPSEAILSFECCSVMLRAVQAHPLVVPFEELRVLATQFQQQQQQATFLLQPQQQQQQQIQQQQASRDTIPDSNFPPEATELARLPPGPESAEIEALANSYFQKIYTTDQNILDVIALLRQFKGSTEKKDQEIFRCMVHNLFDEYRFYHKYPEKELQITGRLFGALIQHQLVSSITLGIALRYVLEALRKDPELGENNDKMFRFGRTALDQFRIRLGEWPQYCSHLIQIPHLGRHCPDMYQEAQRALSSPQQPMPQPPMGMPMGMQMPPQHQQMLGGHQQMHQQQMHQQQLQQQQHQQQQQQQQQMSAYELAGPPQPPQQQQAYGLQHSAQTGGSDLNMNLGGGVSNLTQQFGGLGLSGAAPADNFNASFAGASLNVGGAGGALTGSALPAGLLSSSSALLNTPLSLGGNTSAQSTPLVAPLASALAAQSIASPTISPLPAPATSADVESKSDSSASSAPVSSSEGDSTQSGDSGKVSEIQRMALVNADVLNTNMPPDSVRDQIHFIVNNIAKSNFDAKTQEIRNILKEEHFNWFANYLVVKRISTQPNLHGLYLSVLDALDFNALVKLVLDSAYHNVTKLLQSPNITTSSSERSLLRNLGVWLGQMTLARNKPLLQRRINLKELLFWGFETGRLIAVCSFVAKIVEGVKDSKVFRPPNPWLMALLGIMRELYEIEDLKLNIKFEVQVLCKNINIKIEDIPRGNELSRCRMPVKDQRNPDFNFKQSAAGALASPVVNQPVPDAALRSPLVMASPAGGAQPPPLHASSASSVSLEQQLQAILANLASLVVINPSLQYFTANPTQRRLVAVAVERGIREIIPSAVDRSVTIAMTTTKHLILKDFATEPNEQNLRDGAHLMVSSLCGSLALATCKEPLRIAIGNHLRTLLAQAISDQTVIEQLVQVCSNENVDIGALLIEKASVEKSIREVDEVLMPAFQARRAAREAGQPFIDAANAGGKFAMELPEALRPRMGGLPPNQLRVYDAFQRARLAPPSGTSTPGPVAGSAGPSPNSSGLSGPGAAGDMKALPPASAGPQLSLAQAIEAYQLIYSRIDAALRTLQAQLQGREVTISMLGNEHEILLLLRDLITVTQRTQANLRNETAMTFSESIFNRMFESISSPDPLRFEVFVGILEAIRDACGGAKVFAPDFMSWLGKYAVLVSNDETGRKVYRLILILLLRAKLLRCPELDAYFVACIDGGRNMFWLELALSFIRQCLTENMGTIFEFEGTFDAVTKLRPANPILKKQLQKWLLDIKALATAQDEQKAAAAAAGTPTSGAGAAPTAVVPGSAKDPAVRELVTSLLDRWLRVWSAVNDQIFTNFLQLMEQYGVLKTEESADRFFRVATEICIEACLRNGTAPAGAAPGADAGVTTLNFTVIDALSKLFLLLVRIADKDASNMNVRVNLLSRVLNAAARVILEDHEAKKNSKQAFDQRPYYRLLSNMSHDLGVPDAKQEPSPAVFPMLAAYTQIFLALQPSAVPGFAYAWLQLISRRSFMPHLLLAKGQKGWPYMHRLLSAQLQFLQPFLKSGQMNDSIRKLYKGTLRVLLVLLHDVPEFLSDYHLSFCDLIPVNCVQLRNLVLSAFPRTMRLPDPFTPNLKVDVLLDTAQAPRILTDYSAPLASIKAHLDNYLTVRQPAELPAKLPTILVNNGAYSHGLITALIVYVGTVAISHIQAGKSTLATTPAMDIYKQMTSALDAEGRYIVLNAMANQLRYPNSHTNFFSYVLLNLFLDAESEYLQEQVTRVLLERLIVHRPHPWGLLITFIELIKNPKYNFWRKAFVRSAPEMERVFESIARSCLGAAYSAVQQQQQAAAAQP